MVPAVALAARGDDSRTGGPDWTLPGHDVAGTRSQPFEHLIAPDNVARLAPRWVVTTAGDVSATPTVVAGAGDDDDSEAGNTAAVYFPDWGGKLWKVDGGTGAIVWSRSIADYTGTPGSFSRTTPAVNGNTLYLGDQGGSHVMAVDARTGALRWITQIDPNRWSLITSSPIVVGRLVLVGSSSQENV